MITWCLNQAKLEHGIHTEIANLRMSISHIIHPPNYHHNPGWQILPINYSIDWQNSSLYEVSRADRGVFQPAYSISRPLRNITTFVNFHVFKYLDFEMAKGRNFITVLLHWSKPYKLRISTLTMKAVAFELDLYASLQNH